MRRTTFVLKMTGDRSAAIEAVVCNIAQRLRRKADNQASIHLGLPDNRAQTATAVATNLIEIGNADEVNHTSQESE